MYGSIGKASHKIANNLGSKKKLWNASDATEASDEEV